MTRVVTCKVCRAMRYEMLYDTIFGGMICGGHNSEKYKWDEKAKCLVKDSEFDYQLVDDFVLIIMDEVAA